MPTITIQWSWTEAFDKFGFEDGNGLIETDTVAAVLTLAGYVVCTTSWGSHNYIIASIKHDGVEQIPLDSIRLGYDCPHNYLPATIIKLLDDELPD